MDEDTISKFIDVLVMTAGIATVNSKKTKESSVVVNISLPLRPSVLESVTDMLETVLPEHFEGEERQKKLSENLSIFLSDAIDCGVIERARQVAKGGST